MKKLLSIALAGLLAATLLPGASLAQKPPTQEEEGTVLLPFMHSSGSCYSGVHRRWAIATEQQQGPTGWHFDIDEKTWNKKFVLELTGAQGDADLDIIYYNEFGTIDDVIGDPLNAGTPYAINFENRGPGGEFGKVPPDTTKAIVCMVPGGANATFKYSAGKGVKFPKS